MTASTDAKCVTLRLDEAATVDFWAVDWDHDGQVLRPSFHAAREKKSGALALSAVHTCATPGARQIAVQLVDAAGASSLRRLTVK